MATEQQKARQPIDTEAMRALIAKIKREVGDEASAREIGDELLDMKIEEASAQTDWDQGDSSKVDYLKNKPTPITDADIDALFI